MSFEIVQDAFNIPALKITYQTEDTKILVTLPLVGAKDRTDPQLGKLYEEQGQWIYQTAVEANSQTRQVEQLIRDFQNTANVARRVELLDQMQQAMNPTALVQPLRRP